MRRVDRRWMLDAALERGDAGAPSLARVADLLAAFYAAAEPAITQPGLLGQRMHAQVDANHLVLRTLDDDRAALLARRQHAILAGLELELDLRVARGCVVEAHGDLRPEHILLSDPPAVIDCLEFDRNLRILDRAEELCFLELECARLGHAPVGRWLLEECLRRLSDDASRTLLDYYRGHRSATRAKLYTWRVRRARRRYAGRMAGQSRAIPGDRARRHHGSAPLPLATLRLQLPQRDDRSTCADAPDRLGKELRDRQHDGRARCVMAADARRQDRIGDDEPVGSVRPEQLLRLPARTRRAWQTHRPARLRQHGTP